MVLKESYVRKKESENHNKKVINITVFGHERMPLFSCIGDGFEV